MPQGGLPISTRAGPMSPLFSLGASHTAVKNFPTSGLCLDLEKDDCTQQGKQITPGLFS